MFQKLGIPISIVLAGALIAGALYLVNKDNSNQQAGTTGTTKEQKGTVAKKVRGVQEDDHILGNPNAKIVIVEYSDTECPFCKQFHTTMHRIIDTYGKDGKVAWVYRDFPLTQLHSKAPKEAEAIECAAELGGNDTFWKYIDKLYEITPSNNGLSLDQLPKIAGDIGLDVSKFNECLSSGRNANKVQEDLKEVLDAGGRGTPHSILITTDDGEQMPIEGGQSYEVLSGLIDTILEDSTTQ